jgi:hypothetical protein
VKTGRQVYLETSYISAFVSDRTDPVSAYRRDLSRQWWGVQAHRFELCISAEVVKELSHPAYPHSPEALGLIEGIPLLPITEEVRGLAELLVREKVMPKPAVGDAVHVAAATVHDVDYILSWNVRHLANPRKTKHLRTVCLRLGLLPPQIVTPDLLWEESDE